MNKNNGFHELIMLIIIYAIGLTSTMSLALESKQSPMTLLAASSMENTMQQMHNQDRTDRMQNREEVHDDKCWEYKQQLEAVELHLKGSKSDPTDVDMTMVEGKVKDFLLKRQEVLKQQIKEYCSY